MCFVLNTRGPNVKLIIIVHLYAFVLYVCVCVSHWKYTEVPRNAI